MRSDKQQLHEVKRISLAETVATQVAEMSLQRFAHDAVVSCLEFFARARERRKKRMAIRQISNREKYEDTHGSEHNSVAVMTSPEAIPIPHKRLLVHMAVYPVAVLEIVVDESVNCM